MRRKHISNTDGVSYQSEYAVPFIFLDMNHELAKTLTTALVQFIDKERPEGSICCSSYECEKIEKAFEEGTYDVVENLIKRKISGLTEFEQGIRDMIVNALTTVHESSNGQVTSSVVMDNNTTHLLAAGLLELAKKELLSYADESNPAIEAMADLERAVTCGNIDNIPKWLMEELNKAFKKGEELSHEEYVRGYSNGYKDAEEAHNKSVAYHLNIPDNWPPKMPDLPTQTTTNGI